ncbi:MAG: hypothetical protein Q9190_001765 [Brigantiaea leucoxantha]
MLGPGLQETIKNIKGPSKHGETDSSPSSTIIGALLRPPIAKPTPDNHSFFATGSSKQNRHHAFLPSPTTIESTLVSRQSITTPVGVNVTDIDAGDISPIEDGFLELDSDSGGETNSSGTAVSVANGVGTVGSGQSASNGNGNEGSSSACGLTGCATSGSASNGNSTSTSSSSSGVVNGPVVEGPLVETNGPLIGT